MARRWAAFLENLDLDLDLNFDLDLDHSFQGKKSSCPVCDPAAGPYESRSRSKSKFLPEISLILVTFVAVPLWLFGVGVQQLDHNSQRIQAVEVYVSPVV